MPSADERRLILQMVESGKISAKEGLELLQALGDEPDGVEVEITNPPQKAEMIEEPAEVASAKSTIPYEMARWRRWWVIPLWVGVSITVLGAYWLTSNYQQGGFGLGLACAWVTFLLGVLVITLAWQSQTGRWLHLRITQKPGEWPRTIAFSIPLPLRLVAWFFRTFGVHIHGLKQTSIDRLISALESSTTQDNPLYILANDADDDERVEIYIG